MSRIHAPGANLDHRAACLVNARRHATILHARLARLLHGHRLGGTAGTRRKIPSLTLDMGKRAVLIGGDGV
ncbi:MAG: hypothetical protein K6E40_16330, partial [Desulfovibrio sp.]|nr:hypothetical protein [Desulfovibrio sp.]